MMQYLAHMAKRAEQPDTDLIKPTKERLWRVAGTRVSVDSIVHAFSGGATPEQIVQDYEALTLAQVYGVVHYYLTHRTAVSAYLGDRRGWIRSSAVNLELSTRHFWRTYGGE